MRKMQMKTRTVYRNLRGEKNVDLLMTYLFWQDVDTSVIPYVSNKINMKLENFEGSMDLL